MRTVKVFSAIAMVFATSHAFAACAQIRLGYVDQHRPPYYLGSGAAEPAKPGASIELVRAIAASAGCEVVTVRLPLPRLRAALAAGTIDAMPMDASAEDAALFALPRNKAGQLDRGKALRYNTVVFVRAADKLAAGTDPAVYFKTHTLGVNHGASMVMPLQALGYRVDDGALDAPRNLEKLLRNRIDGFGVSLVSVADMDRVVAAKYGEQLVRMDKPLRVTHIWLAFSKGYYEKNPKQTETMWNWIGTNGSTRFAELMKKYENEH